MAETESDEARTVNVGMNRGQLVLSVVMLVVIIALAYWAFSERRRANELATDLNHAETTIEAVEESSTGGDCDLDMTGWSEADLAAFTSAFESGDYDQVRALFTEDGVLTTAANVHDAIVTGDTSRLADRVDEAEFRRLATLHGGEEFHILGLPTQVGDNTVAFGWKWSGGVSGTALLHLRDGKIVIAVLNPSQYRIPFAGEK
jgi:hypothetical protein